MSSYLEFIWFGALWHSAVFGVLNYDEAWYLTASHLVFNGQLLYRDFAFTQGPLLPYVYGAALWLLGVNLAIGRFVSVVLATLALALVLNMAHRMAGMRAAVVAFLLLVATPDVLYSLAIVKTYPVAAALALLALAMALHSGRSPAGRVALLSTLAAGMAVMTRISFLPVVVFVSLFWVWRGRGRASGLGLLVLGLVTLVLAASSNGNMLFDLLEYHMRRVRVGNDPLASAIDRTLATFIVFGPALVWALFLLMLWGRAPGFRSRLAEWWRTEMDTKVLLLVVAMALVIVHFLAPAELWEYQIPGYLLVIVLLAAMSAPVGDIKHQPGWAFLLAVCLVATSLALWSYRSRATWRPANTLLSASKASEILAQRGAQGNTVLGEFNHLALASGLQIYPGNEMGLFSVADGSSPAETTFRHLLSKEAVADALDSCSATFVGTDAGRLFPISVPSTLEIAEVTQNQWRDLLHEKYRIIYSEGVMTIFERILEKCNSSVPSISEEGMLGHQSVGPKNSR